MADLKSLHRAGFAEADARGLATALQALADPNRLYILAMLCADGPQSVTSLTARMPIAQPTVTHHLNLLEAAGLVEREKIGSHVYSRVLRPAVTRLGRALTGGAK